MRIFSVVGVRRSGKTTTITQLIGALKQKGYTVGTVKTIFCPAFTMDDPKSNTARHKAAGADVVCARGNGETDFIYPCTMEQNEIFEKINPDFLILEGDYEAQVPRIVCAHTPQEVAERKNGHTFAVSGRISEEQEQVEGITAVSAVTQLEKLVALVEEYVTETLLPVDLCESKLAYTGICQCGCHKGNQEPEIRLHPSERKHIFLTGEKQVGKSTIIEAVLKEQKAEKAGFVTRPYEVNGVRKGFVMHGLKPVEGYLNDIPVSIRIGEKTSVPIQESFETFGVSLLRQVRGFEGITVMDELGKLEQDASGFWRGVHECLNENRLVLGVLQKKDARCLKELVDRADVCVYEITEENREQMKTVISNAVKEQMNLWINK